MSKKKSKKLRAKSLKIKPVKLDLSEDIIKHTSLSIGGGIKPTPKIETLIVEGTFYAPSGYSSSTREFFHHFIKNYTKKYKNIYLIDRQWDQIKMVLHPKYDETIGKHVVKEGVKMKDINPETTMIMRWGIPTAFDYKGFKNTPHRIKSLYFVWECDRLPPLWVDLLVYYDVIFTCSVASKKAIKTSIRERGMTQPVIIIPHGVADHYNKIDKVHTLDGFTFLSIGTFTKRKAPLEMIGAFIQEFNSGENVRLIWKIGSISNPSQMLSLRREIQKMAFQIDKDMTLAPKIILDMNTYDSNLLNEFYNESNCMIQVSHGEAWGLPILNGMATGTPALVLDKGGHKSYANKKTSFFVKSGDLIYADGLNDWYASAHGVKWNSINLDDYRTQMRYVYDNPEELKSKAKAGLIVAKKFSWNNVVKKAYKIFNNLNIQIPSKHEQR